MLVKVAAPIFLALFLAAEVAAIIPRPCANLKSLTDRTCCPTPDISDDNNDPCGENLGRGRCELVSVSPSLYDTSESDVRKNWPIQYFERVCMCNSRYGGYDCGECSYGYNDGDKCEEKTVHKRVSVGNMDDDDWEKYRSALRKIKDTPARYMVANDTPSTSIFTSYPQAVNNSLVRPSTYDLFVWIHHFVAKDSEASVENGDDIVDYAHEGTGFPTWHRLFLLWLEREIQVAIDDHTFRLPYWDWSQLSQREILFKKDRLGENVDEGSRVVVKGDLFDNGWDTFCWENTSGLNTPIPICDPTVSSNQTLRRCPNATLCEKDNDQWPSADDIDEAVSISAYDASPYDRCVTEKDASFRNYMEGFIVKDSCGSDSMCSESKYCTKDSVTRKLHNTVHIILGLGDIKNGKNLKFTEQGVMSCVAASPNDPVFINHHANIDHILEQWLQKNKDSLNYPLSSAIREGHRGTDYIVPFIPVYTHNDMFKTADNFGYECSAFTTQAYDLLIFSLALATAALVMSIH